MKKFLIENGYQTLLFLGVLYFAIASAVGTDEIENLRQIIAAWSLVIVGWLHRMNQNLEALRARDKDIHVYLSNSMSPNDIADAIAKSAGIDARRGR